MSVLFLNVTIAIMNISLVKDITILIVVMGDTKKLNERRLKTNE